MHFTLARLVFAVLLYSSVLLGTTRATTTSSTTPTATPQGIASSLAPHPPSPYIEVLTSIQQLIIITFTRTNRQYQALMSLSVRVRDALPALVQICRQPSAEARIADLEQVGIIHRQQPNDPEALVLADGGGTAGYLLTHWFNRSWEISYKAYRHIDNVVHMTSAIMDPSRMANMQIVVGQHNWGMARNWLGELMEDLQYALLSEGKLHRGYMQLAKVAGIVLPGFVVPRELEEEAVHWKKLFETMPNLIPWPEAYIGME